MLRKLLKHTWARHLFYWISFVLFFTIVWGTADGDYFTSLKIQLCSLPSRLVLVYVTLRVLFVKYFKSKQYVKLFFLYLLLLIFTGVFIQRPMMLYFARPFLSLDWVNPEFFVVTEIVNTILDVNLAAILPISNFFYKAYKTTYEKSMALEKQSLNQGTGDIEGFLLVKVEKTLQKLPLSEIVYIESQKNYVKICTTKKKIYTYKSISSVEEELPKDYFIRIHRSFIIGRHFIESFSPSKVVVNGFVISVGRKYKERLKNELGYF
ncbi:LytR/AlgR family response regulator transcription factor [Flagellimonas allohymeniacidonis]|uniref:LytTR family transcriptional regulator n=1 Tax=Flagellimonas allohymeniacidonis TaxID=2517819 RepID=A0A4Q8QG98_9FLAO|nr:LytTR family DNA-binding domain-containing protein [Allomuricauda hymeniacidonis]TAI49582.1 LytTR family transcriptional regulator [Allomuricauda hymeniacidonis]